MVRDVRHLALRLWHMARGFHDLELVAVPGPRSVRPGNVWSAAWCRCGVVIELSFDYPNNPKEKEL